MASSWPVQRCLYMKITDEMREDLIRQALLYKRSVRSICQETGIKYPTAKHIVSKFMTQVERGDKVWPRPKQLDLNAWPNTIRRKLPSFEFLDSNVDKEKEHDEEEESAANLDEGVLCEINEALRAESVVLKKRFRRRTEYEPRLLKVPRFGPKNANEEIVIDLTLIK